MTAVVMALSSAALFGLMTVLVRVALRRAPEPRDAPAALILPALAIAVVAAAAIDPGGVEDAWPFALAGLLAPGASQIFFMLAVGAVGASRTSVVVGTAPLVSVAIALAWLGEPLSAPLLLGAVLVVAGGIALVGERGRPEHLRVAGLVSAAVCTVLFATRDNLVRRFAVDPHSVPAGTANAAALAAGALVALAYARRLPPARTLLSFLPAGACFGISYVLLFEAFYRGRVEVVAPLVATESLWGVGLAALVLRRSELVGRRLAVGAVLVVAGGALIGAFR
ncbi:MAG TPA: DMT family transporter [Gaiellaceae bacterium]|nr:DMT family transporter [Gaiellaceae bacterium]